MPPQITTIIPTYRREKQLIATLDSVLGQANVSLEVIVVDDSPEASAGSIVRDLKDRRIEYIHNDNPTGGYPSRVRNLALPRATSPLLHFLDDDDIVPEGHYSRVLNRFARRPEVGLVFGSVEPFGDGPEEQLIHERAFFAEARRLASLCRTSGSRLAFVSAHLFHHVLLVCSAGVVRRECVNAVGGFDPELRLMEDAAFYTFIMRRFGVDFVDDVTVHYRINNEQSLMHVAVSSPEEVALTREHLKRARVRTFAKYRNEFGFPEFLALRTCARTVFKVL
jgi:glycosyltransferase involved in cell wall biosynthesis